MKELETLLKYANKSINELEKGDKRFIVFTSANVQPDIDYILYVDIDTAENVASLVLLLE